MKISKLVQQEKLKPQIVISVRNLVEFLLNAGDIDAVSYTHLDVYKRQGYDKIIGRYCRTDS